MDQTKSLPDEIEAEVLNISKFSQNSQTRQQYRYSAYVPHGTDIRFAVVRMDNLLNKKLFNEYIDEIRNHNKLMR